MSVSGLCQICEEREVVDACDRCGRLVCERHLEEGTGLCTECYAEVDGEWRNRGDRSGRDGRGPDGVDTYQF
ncbi:MAG: hypothetical protein ABEJ05_10125 [Haloglomus sp.]